MQEGLPLLASRLEAAAFLSVSPLTMNVWDCTKRYNLEPRKIGQHVYYPWTALFRFISLNEADYQDLLQENDRRPLLDRKRAARYIRAAERTVIRWDRYHKPDLKPRLVGSIIRYRVADLDAYLEMRMRP